MIILSGSQIRKHKRYKLLLIKYAWWGGLLHTFDERTNWYNVARKQVNDIDEVLKGLILIHFSFNK
jgi:hypothetical protein